MSNVFAFQGRLGADATKHEKNGKTFARFRVANDVGYGKRKSTQWVTCWIFGKRAGSALIDHLTKGQSVFVTGELRVEAKDGKAEMNLNVNALDLTGSAPRSQDGGSGGNSDDFDDDIPF